MSDAARLLIVDDEPGIRFAMRDFLSHHGYDVVEATTCAEAVLAFRDSGPDLVVLDYSLPDGTALELLPRLRSEDPTVPVIVLTAHGSIDLAVRAVKEGAEQFLTKPIELPALLAVVARTLEHQRDRKVRTADTSRESREQLDPFAGDSPAVRRLEREARLALETTSPILLTGETGSGKGVLARWLHRHGPRTTEAFVDLNCAGLSRELLESELFGHERGAFTGAVTTKQGLLDLAHRGTLFLDEIGDMDLAIQPKLLKVLEEQRFRRLGDVRERRVDMRLVAATHQALETLVAAQRFRADLYYRIGAIPLRVPPLRERQEDIPVLARALLARLASDLGRPGVHLADDADAALRGYDWPGNVRELRNVLERAILHTRTAVSASLLRLGPTPGTRSAPSGEDRSSLTLEEVQRQHVEAVLRAELGRVEPAAARLGIPRSTLYQLLKRFGIRTGRR